MTYYRFYTINIQKTREEQISDSVTFHPHLCDTPNIINLVRIVIAAKDLTLALKHPHRELPMLVS